MKRCIQCILPANYPGITFNKDGVCSLCIEHEELNYRGDEALKRDIRNFLKNKSNSNSDYDCLLGVSGGRDSTYLLYYLAEVLDLKVLAYSVNHGFIPGQTMENMKRATEKLKIELIIEDTDDLKNCIRHTISTWIKKPSLPMIETFCTGCRIGPQRGMINYGKKHNIPVLIRGGTPFEKTAEFKSTFMKINNQGGVFAMILGYLSNIARNPRWLFNYHYLTTQSKEFFYLFYEDKMLKMGGLIKYRPFFDYTRWVEEDVLDVIENKLDWEKNPDSESTWRSDCDLAFLKLFMYKYIIGFNDKTVNLSHLIRDRQITLQDAIERSGTEEIVPERLLKKFFNRIGIDYTDFKNALDRARNEYRQKKIKIDCQI